MTDVACDGEEIRVDALAPLLPPLLALLVLELLVSDVGDVDADDDEEKAVFAFSAALFLTILRACSTKYRVGMSVAPEAGDRTVCLVNI